jgi:tetratricopeptide (TPR) repeat protein
MRDREWPRLVGPALAFLIALPLTNCSLLDEGEMRAASYLNLAGIMLNERREQEAEPYLARAAALQPENPDLHFHYAVLHYREGRFEQAEESLREMIRLEETDVRGHRLLASTLKRLGRKEEALRVHRRAMELDPDRGVRHPPKEDRPRVVPRERPEAPPPAQ